MSATDAALDHTPHAIQTRLGRPSKSPPVLRVVFDHMRLCQPPTSKPKGKVAESKKQKSRENYEAKRKYFETFRGWIAKTPLHSRRWFLVDNVVRFDAAEEELLRLEWSKKMIWEKRECLGE